ncbi:MAG: osmoprotectant transporter permease [Alphaproteobacteria bacterium]
MVLFGILCGIDALIAAIVLVFFFWGLADGSVSAFNIHLWLAVLAGVAAVLGGGIALRAGGQRIRANVVLAVLATPGLLFGLMLLLVLVLQPDFR